MENTKPILPPPLTLAEKSKIILLWKKGIPISKIADDIKISYNRTYDCILKHRVKNGDLEAESTLAKLRASRGRAHKKTFEKKVLGQVIREVEPYRCQACKKLVTFFPCVACLIAEKNKTEKFVHSKIWDQDEKISYELSAEEDARRQEIHDRIFRNRSA